MKLASVFAFLPWAVTASVASEGTFYRSGMYVKPYLELLSTERELMGTADTCPPGSFDNEVNDEEIAKGNKYSQGSKFVKQLKDFRDGSNNYYEKTLRMMMTYYCHDMSEKGEEVLADRCGEMLDPGDIALNATMCNPFDACPKGHCEVPANCYWQPLRMAPNGKPMNKEGEIVEDRERWYTDEEGDSAANDLYGFDPEDVNPADLIGIDRNSYLFSICKYMGFGIVGAIVNLFLWLFFIIGRCCCCCFWRTVLCRCCSPTPKEEGYKVCCQIRIPIAFFMIFLAGIVTSASITYVGNEDITAAIDSTFEHSREGIADLQDFLNASVTPMKKISDLVESAKDDSLEVTNNTDYVRSDMDLILASLTDFTNIYRDGIDAAGAGDDLDATVGGLNDQVGPIVDTIELLIGTLQDKLIEGSAKLQDGISGGVNQVESIYNMTENIHASIDDFDEMSEEYDDLRKAGVLAIFAVALVCIFFGLLGIFAYFTPCKGDDILIYLFNLTWFFGFMIVSLSFLLGGTLLFLSVMWSDLCQFSDIMTKDFDPYLDGMAATGMNACFQNTPLVEAFQLQNQTDFQAIVDKQLDEMKSQNMTESFSMVTEPIDQIVGLLEDLPFSPLMFLLNNFTNVANVPNPDTATQAAATFCQFNQAILEVDVEEPWTGKSGNTLWKSGVTGNFIDMTREGTETNIQYMNRVFNIGGICGLDASGEPIIIVDPNTGVPSQGNNCLPGTAQPYDGNAPVADSYCTGGEHCVFNPCDSLINGITVTENGEEKKIPGINDGPDDTPGLYESIVDLKEMQRNMLKDLGSKATKNDPPSSNFISRDYDKNIFGMLDSYQGKLAGTFDNLLDIANSAVGDIMIQVRNFLCNMNCGFVGNLWGDVYNDICVSLLGGMLQISLSLWLLAVFLFFSSALGAILVVRMRGISVEEGLGEDEGLDSESEGALEMKSVSLDLYN